MRLILDPDTYAVLPWSPADSRRARVFCDIYTPNGDPFEGDPRGTLKRQLKRLEEKGWTFNIGPEPEFFLFKGENGHGVHPVPHDTGGYFDFSSFDEAVVVRTALMEALCKTFRNRYDIEKDNDGGVLEIKIGNGAFVDIVAAGGTFVEGGYNGTISVSFGSPIAGRQAWTGLSAGFVPTTVNLPAAAAGETIVLRWRLATDRSLGKLGQWIDTVSITGRDVCATGTQFTCEDHDACTVDSCDPVLGCGYTWIACDDGKLCTDDVCDPVFQCVHANNVAPCDDHDACTLGDACLAGVCAGATAVSCHDVDRCTVDVCDPVVQCLSSTTNLDASGFSAARVDGRDLAVFAAAWYSCLGTERYNPAVDLDHRGSCIDIDDFHLFMSSFGLSCPS
jgi:hypothetical protein